MSGAELVHCSYFDNDDVVGAIALHLAGGEPASFGASDVTEWYGRTRTHVRLRLDQWMNTGRSAMERREVFEASLRGTAIAVTGLVLGLLQGHRVVVLLGGVGVVLLGLSLLWQWHSLRRDFAVSGSNDDHR
jgi:hypothetical protein